MKNKELGIQLQRMAKTPYIELLPFETQGKGRIQGHNLCAGKNAFYDISTNKVPVIQRIFFLDFSWKISL